MPPLGIFDSDGFYLALDAERQARRLRWKDVASEAGVSASTLSRLGQGRRLDVGSLAALSLWAQLAVDAFIRPTQTVQARHAQPLSVISSQLRSDPQLSEEAARTLDAVLKTAYAQLRLGSPAGGDHDEGRARRRQKHRQDRIPPAMRPGRVPE